MSRPSSGVGVAGLRVAPREGSSPELRVERGGPKRTLDARCVMLTQPVSPQARSYRLLRHQLLTHLDPRVVVVTSALNGEGKTTCAINLALCIAEETLASVLLLEANPHRPSLAQVFGMATLLEGAREGNGDAPRAPRVFAL